MNKSEVLKQYFGYDSFRSLQAEAIDHILANNDAMILMPTGGGKSLCFQIPALIFEGITVVISPLIALMKDQVQALKYNGITAEYINSSLNQQEQAKIENRCRNGQIKLLYISPEKLLTNNYLAFIQSLNLSLVAIDESHCVSVWGHDFRPEYLQLNLIKKTFPNVPMVALTATADRTTRKDILKQLGIANAKVFIDSFDRPNLSLTVLPGRNRLQMMQKFINDRPRQSGIIYCFSRKNTETVASSLQKLGFNARFYHAGMSAQERSLVQDEFVKDNIQIMVATVAFGMGIDKSNVRWIMHYNMPANVESFYQEIGRAGRDGLPSDTLLFYSFSDYVGRREIIEKSTVNNDLKEILQAKLDRMKQYAEAQICRRRILISYFNENVPKDCGNCDVCQNPPQRFDATIIAQKALSAIVRTNESEAMTMIIDVLRGSRNKHVLEKKYNTLKTYGVGQELRYDEWAEYICQMLNMGVMDIAYDEEHAFKLNDISWKILKNEHKVELTRFESFEEKRAKQQTVIEANKPRSQKEIIRDEFFEVLRQLRKQIADSEGVPPFVVFSDATISDMAQRRPTNASQMMRISGVGQTKMERYGRIFMDKIKETQGCDTQDDVFQETFARPPKAPKIDTFAETLRMYRLGLSPSEIAQQRELSETTIFGHLAKLYEQGHKDEIKLDNFISKHEYEAIIKGAKEIQMSRGDALKPLFELLDQQYDYHKIRIALTIWGGE